MNRWSDFWMGVMVVVLIGVLLTAVRAGGPVESPTRWNVPYEELRKAFPDSVLTAQQFLVLTAVFQDLSRHLYNSGLFTFEAIRNPLIQHDTVRIVADPAGLDSIRFYLPQPYKDTSYAVSVSPRGYNGTNNPQINNRLAGSFNITTSLGGVSSVLYDVITAGTRP